MHMEMYILINRATNTENVNLGLPSNPLQYIQPPQPQM